jgi:LysM repeat protein
MTDILSDKARLSLYKKSSASNISTGILEEVYRRGFESWDDELNCTPEQLGFDRVNSFIAGGFAAELDEDLKQACWKGYEAVGMKKKNGKKVPNCVPVKEVYTGAEKTSNDMEKPNSRFDATSNLVKVYKDSTPGYSDTYKTVKKVVREQLEEDWQKVNRHDKTDGLSQKAVDAYKREHPGSKLQTAVTEKNPKGKRASRRKSFCSRMSGMKKRLTSAKTAHDPDSRINKALRRWNCEETIQEAVIDISTSAAPQVHGLKSTTKLSRNAPAELSSRGQSQGLNRSGNTFRSTSQVTPSGLRSMKSSTATPTSRLAPSSGSTLKPTSVSGPQAATPKTTTPSPRASFGSGGGSMKPSSVNASIKTQTAAPSSTPSGGKAPAPSAPSTKAVMPKGVEIGKSAPRGSVAGKLGGAIALATAGAALGKATASRYKEQHGSQHQQTPGVSTKQSFERMKGMKAPEPAKGTVSVEAPKKISGQYKGGVGDTTIKKGQTLSGIAKAKGTTVSDIMSKNPVLNANKVRAGSKIFTGNAPTPPKRPTMEETINELSPETLGSYVTGAQKQIDKTTARMVKNPGSISPADDHLIQQRKAGIDLAKTKMEDTTPLGTTGKRAKWDAPSVAIRMASGKIEKHPPGKSSSSGGGGDE